MAAQQVVEAPVSLSNTEFRFRLWDDRGRCLTCLSRRSLARQILGHGTVDVSRCLSFSEEPALPLPFTLSCVAKYFLDFAIQQSVLWMNSISGLCPETLTVTRLSLIGHHQLKAGMREASLTHRVLKAEQGFSRKPVKHSQPCSLITRCTESGKEGMAGVPA